MGESGYKTVPYGEIIYVKDSSPFPALSATSLSLRNRDIRAVSQFKCQIMLLLFGFSAW